ncbi:unnamed protein product [Thelazia callipaeda]|uniref:Transmembrane protein n=1 Tax=Thelazia callipaeda TaxID=103827 RepID=A0A0N5D2X6_THECL|nr:unnamed protein product [Thelazia callipaeda]
MRKWEKRMLQLAAAIGTAAYPTGMIAFHARLISFGRKHIEYDVPDEIVDLVESELDKLDNLLLKVNTKIAVTDSLNPEWRGGFYLRHGFELFLPIRAVAKSVSELPKMNRISIINSAGTFSSKQKTVNTATAAAKNIFNDYLLSEAARRFIIRRELLRANRRSFVLGPIFIWILLSSIVSLLFILMMRFGRAISYGTVAVSIPVTVFTFRQALRDFVSYSEKILDHDAYSDSSEYMEGAREYLASSVATNLKIRQALQDWNSEFIKPNGDSVGDAWPYSKRLEELEDFDKKKKQRSK